MAGNLLDKHPLDSGDFRLIKGFSNYFISSDGRFYSMISQKILNGKDSNGYLTVSLTSDIDG